MALTANTPLSMTIALESDLEPFSKLRKFDIRNVSRFSFFVLPWPLFGHCDLGVAVLNM